jgi:hypothetical protein
MTAPPEMRDLAHCLLAYEAVAVQTSGPVQSATLRVYEKLRQSFVVFAGVAGFQLLASRALVLARSAVPILIAAQVTTDGSLVGHEFGTQIDTDKDGIDEGGVILIAHLLGLLVIFLGEALTLSLLRIAWPGATFGNRQSESGRKA